MGDILRIPAGSTQGPACRIDGSSQQSTQQDVSFNSRVQHLKLHKSSHRTRRWFRLGTDSGEFASQRHEALMKASKAYRYLDLTAQVFGAYDSRTPQAHRGGMVKGVRWLMDLERTVDSR